MNLNGLQMLLLGLAVLFIVLLPIHKKLAMAYARYTLLAVVGTVMLIPFAWLICAAFKQQPFESMFLPPPGEVINHQIVALNDGTSVQGVVTKRDNQYTIVTRDGLGNAETRRVAEADVKSIVRPLNFGNFTRLFAPRPSLQGPVYFWQYIINSLFLASAATFLAVLFSSMGGYALAKYRFHGRAPLVIFMLASMTIPGIVLLSPNYEIIWRLGWMDTYKALLVPGCVSVFGVFLYRQAMVGVPDDLIEAGRIDGCGEFKIYLNLVMPLVRPMTGAFCLITFLGTWNAFLGPNIYLQTQNKLTLPVVLNQYIGVYTQEYGVFLAGTLLAIIPPAILFFALQREFISGLTSGAVKQ
jgi:ABC-type glycerol-3-phosphate transport system permease component